MADEGDKKKIKKKNNLKKRRKRLERERDRKKKPNKKGSAHSEEYISTVRHSIQRRDSSTCLVSMGRRDVIWYSGRLPAHQLCPPSLPFFVLFLSFSLCARLRRLLLLHCSLNILYIRSIYLYKCTAEPTLSKSFSNRHQGYC